VAIWIIETPNVVLSSEGYGVVILRPGEIDSGIGVVGEEIDSSVRRAERRWIWAMMS